MENGFPSSPHSRLWSAFVSALQTDSVLASRVRLWQVWDGSENQHTEPTIDDLPYLRLDLLDSQAAWMDETSHKYQLPIRVTIALETRHLTDLLDYWHAINTALFTGNTLLNALIPLGLYQKTIVGLASKPVLMGGAEILEGTGQITLRARFDT